MITDRDPGDEQPDDRCPLDLGVWSDERNIVLKDDTYDHVVKMLSEPAAPTPAMLALFGERAFRHGGRPR